MKNQIVYYILLKKLEYFGINCFCTICFLIADFSKEKIKTFRLVFMKGVKCNILICKLGHQTYPAHTYSSMQPKMKRRSWEDGWWYFILECIIFSHWHMLKEVYIYLHDKQPFQKEKKHEDFDIKKREEMKFSFIA